MAQWLRFSVCLAGIMMREVGDDKQLHLNKYRCLVNRYKISYETVDIMCIQGYNR